MKAHPHVTRCDPDWNAFWMPKGGHGADAYEDAFRLPTHETFPLRLAVADGAAAFARAWARLLVEGFVMEGSAEAARFGERLRRWQGVWQAATSARVVGLPGYGVAEAGRQGALAAFLGLALREDPSWQALAVGDCCLFHLRRADVLRAWPIETPDAFSRRPARVPSLPGSAVPLPLTTSGAWQAGDAFLLATGALAAWLMRVGPAAALTFTPSSFQARVVAARAEGSLKNDDVTLVVVRC